MVVTDQITDAAFINADTGFITTSSGVLFKTVNGGSTWTYDTVNPGGRIIRIQFPTPRIGYMTTYPGTLYTTSTILKSIDGGNSWFDTGHGNNVTFGKGLYFLNADTGMIGCGGGLCYRTINGGLNWTWTFVGSGPIDDLFFLNDSLAFIKQRCVGTIAGSLTISKDGGNSWAPDCRLGSSLYDQSYYAYLLKDSTFIAFSYMAGRLTKGNIDGTDVRFVFPQDSIYKVNFQSPGSGSRNIRFYNEQLGMINFTKSIIRTDDGGETWIITDLKDTTDYSPLCGSSAFYLEHIVPITESKWIVFGHCGLVYITENKGGIWSGIDKKNKDGSFEIYPNPGSTNITCTFPSLLDKATIQILSTEGVTVMQKTLVTQHTFEINVGALPKGLYVIALQDERERVFRRFVKE